MSKNVTEYGKEIADIVRNTPPQSPRLAVHHRLVLRFPERLDATHHGTILPRPAPDDYCIGRLYAGQGRTDSSRLGAVGNGL